MELGRYLLYFSVVCLLATGTNTQDDQFNWSQTSELPEVDEFLPTEDAGTSIELQFSSRNLNESLDFFLPNSTAVEIINITWNQIQKVEESVFSYYPALQSIDYSHNPVKEIEILESSTLQELHLSYGDLQWVRESSIRGLTNLRSLFLDHNRHLVVIEPVSRSLWFLDATRCSVTEILTEGLPSLRVYNVSHNRIAKIEENNFWSNQDLETLDLSFNDITHIAEYAFIRNKKLQYLDLSHNEITTTDWSIALSSVLLLNISYNLITNIDMLIMKNGLQLNVSNNMLASIPEEIDRLLPRLETLDAHGNSIRTIKRLKSNTLTQLFMQDCKIHKMEDNALREAPKLQVLNINDNKLQDLAFLRDLRNLSSLFLADNPWSCNCSLPVPLHVICQTSNQSIAEYCANLNTLTTTEEPWIIEATSPVIWAPLLAGLLLAVIGCFGYTIYFRKKIGRSAFTDEEEPVDLVQNIPLSDADVYRKLLKERLTDSPLRFSFRSNSDLNRKNSVYLLPDNPEEKTS